MEVLLRLQGIHPVNPLEGRELYEILGTLSARAGLYAVPRLYWIPSRTPNAFAAEIGGDQVIALSSGLLQNLSAREVQGVLAHEIAHLKNDDPKILRLAQISTQATTFLSHAGQMMAILLLPFSLIGFLSFSLPSLLFLILAPWLSTLIQSYLSRQREWEADRVGAILSKDPLGLAQALEKMHRLSTPWYMRVFGINPEKTVPRYFSSHPETRDRISRLKRQAEEYRGPILSPYWSSPPRPSPIHRNTFLDEWIYSMMRDVMPVRR